MPGLLPKVRGECFLRFSQPPHPMLVVAINISTTLLCLN
jgi:hypothetical protein